MQKWPSFWLQTGAFSWLTQHSMCVAIKKVSRYDTYRIKREKRKPAEKNIISERNKKTLLPVCRQKTS